MIAASAPLERLIGFVGFVRGNGFNVGIGEGLAVVAAAAHGGVTAARSRRWEMQSILCSNRRDWERFDELFDAYFRPPNRRVGAAPAGGRRAERRSHCGRLQAWREATDAAGDGQGGASGLSVRAAASAREGLGQTDFSELRDREQMEAMEQLVDRLARNMRKRLRRRLEHAAHGARIDLRRTIRASLGRGGVPLDLVCRRRRRQLPRLIMILDVSRSMSLYSFMFLRFARGILEVFRDAEAFVFHTRLVRVSDALRERDWLRLREKLTLISLGWAGGTRIGESLQRFNADYARSLLQRASTVVVIVSDGLDTGAPALLAAALEEMRARARRLIWLNPLLGRPGYEPRAAGMQAALPHLDVFAPAHNLESLAALLPVLAT